MKLKLFFTLVLYFAVYFSYSQQYEHLIIYGQSLSTGQQSWPPLSTTNVAGNFMVGSQVWTNYGNSGRSALNPLIANVDTWTRSLPKNRGAQSNAECPVVGMANHLQLVTSGTYKFIASSCGTGGKSIEELSKEYTNPDPSRYWYGSYTNAINYAYNITQNIHCPALIWMQGEYNYSQMNRGLTPGSPNVTDKEGYKELLVKLKNNMQADVMSKYNQSDYPIFITYQTGAQYTRGKEITIGTAQLEASNEYSDIICAGPVYQMTDRGGHLDPNGYRWYGEMLAKAYYRTVILGEKFKPLQPVEIQRTDDPKKIKIKFYVPQLPLVLDKSLVPYTSPGHGFQVYLNGGTSPESIQVSIENEYVILTGTRDLTGTIEVSYASNLTAGNGNLRDSDDYPAKYNYLDLDKKDSNGNYVFERDATETTLRPNFQPRDLDGIIFDKPYPLYNFCTAFYYKMDAGQQSFSVPNAPATSVRNIYVEDGSIRLTSANLEISTAINDIKTIELIDLSGKTVRKLDGKSTNLSFSRIPQGVYIVKIGTPTKNYISKQIVSL